MSILTEALGLQDGGVLAVVGGGGKTTLCLRLLSDLMREGRSVLFTTTTKIFPPGMPSPARTVVASSPMDVMHYAQDLPPKRRCLAAGSGINEAGKWIGYPPEAINDFHHSGLWDWILVEADGAAGRPVKGHAAHEPVIPRCTTHCAVLTGLDALDRPLDSETVHRPGIFARFTGLAPGDRISSEAIAAMITHPYGPLGSCPKGAFTCAVFNKSDIPDSAKCRSALVASLQDAVHRPPAGTRDLPCTVNRMVITSLQSAMPVNFYFDLGPRCEATVPPPEMRRLSSEAADA